MKKLSIIVIAVFCSVSAQKAGADVARLEPDFDIPDSVGGIRNPEDLRPYILSARFEDRRAACVRLGQVKGEKAFGLLVQAFEREPYFPAIETDFGIHYYALVSIAEIGGGNAIGYLLSAFKHHSFNFRGARRFSAADSLDALRGAYDGLRKTSSNQVFSFMDSIFVDSTRGLIARTYAFMYMTEYDMREHGISGDRDKVSYLIEQLGQVAGNHFMLNPDRSINPGFIKSGALELLLFEHKEIAITLLERFIAKLPSGDSRAGYLDSLWRSMQGLSYR